MVMDTRKKERVGRNQSRVVGREGCGHCVLMNDILFLVKQATFYMPLAFLG